MLLNNYKTKFKKGINVVFKILWAPLVAVFALPRSICRDGRNRLQAAWGELLEMRQLIVLITYVLIFEICIQSQYVMILQ